MSSKTPTASARAYTQLRTEILDGDLAAGSVLYEVDQATRLGVSRTPVREAFGRLVADGLVESGPGRGLVVTEVTDDDIDSLFEMRACLEAQAARLAAQRGAAALFEEFADRFRDSEAILRDPGATAAEIADYYALIRRFDIASYTAAGNPFLIDALETLRTHVARVRRKAATSPERLAASAVEHALIASAIADGDAALAAHATHVHLHNSLTHLRRAMTAVVAGDSPADPDHPDRRTDPALGAAR